MTVSGFTLLSRILGLVRDMVISHYLGVGKVSDAWNAAFQFPNLFRRVFGEGAFNAAFVPMYSGKLEENGEKSAFDFGSRVLILLSLILAILFLICFIFIHPIIWSFNSGFAADQLELAVKLARVTTGYMFFICLLAALSSILNSHKKFGAPAFSYGFLNIALLVGLLIFVPITRNPEWVLAWSLLASGVLQLLVVVVPAWRMGFRIHWKLPNLRSDPDMKRLALLMLPGLMSAGIQQINLLVGSWVASFQEGAKTLLYNADRVNQLPLGLIGIAFGVVLLPDLSRKVRSNDHLAAIQSMRHGMLMAMFLAIPAMMGMIVLGEELIYGLFVSGRFTGSDATAVSHALAAFALGCPAYIMSRVLQPGYYAREDTKTPMRFTFISAVVNILLCAAAYLLFKGSGYLHVACAGATSIAGWVNVILLASGLRKTGFINTDQAFWLKLAKMLVASLVMGAVVYLIAHLLAEPLHGSSRLIRVALLLATGAAGMIAYFLSAHFLKAMTLQQLRSGFRRQA